MMGLDHCPQQKVKVLMKRFLISKLVAAALCSTLVSSAFAWDHPGHMTTAAIAFAEIERARPDLIEKVGLLMLKHPDPAPFWVATVNATGKERVRRMFMEVLADDPRGRQG